MKLHAPFEIGSRLLPELKIGDGRVSLEPTRSKDRYGKRVWRWYIDTPAGDFSQADLRGHGDTQETFSALLAFLSACADSYRVWLHSGEQPENLDIFPVEIAEWACRNYDEIDALLDKMETPGLIEED
jgi:hypothetical protein